MHGTSGAGRVRTMKRHTPLSPLQNLATSADNLTSVAPIRSSRRGRSQLVRRWLTTLLCCSALGMLAVGPTSGDAVAKSRRKSKKRGKRARSGHSSAKGPAWWIHREKDKPLGWLFGKHLNQARQKKQSVIVMFTADWCSPCKSIKEFVAGSAVVRGAFRKHKGRLLYIDVDEWRGPAHRLIPGVNPRKLPTLVRIDGGGQKVIVAYGSELGLLSEDAVATNFGRLIDGKPLTKPFYEGNSAKQTELMRAQHSAREARNNKVKELTVKRIKGNQVRLRIRNLDGPRRWYLIPLHSERGLQTAPNVSTMATMKFNEHVRATYLRFEGKRGFIAMPVAGYGDVDLIGLSLPGRGKKLEVWELNRLDVDGQSQQFNRKLPYHQRMKQAQAVSTIDNRPVKSVKYFVKRKLSATIQ